ncbi:MAG: DUF4339 domain-containing protein [Micropepsaceae bacterium]
MLRLIQAFAAMIVLALPAAAGPNGITQAESWFYIERNVTKGPLYERQIVELAEDGVIRASTQVFEPGRGWTFARNIPALQPHVGGAAAGGRSAAPQRPQRSEAELWSGPLVMPAPRAEAPRAGVTPPPTHDVPPASVEAELERALGAHLVGSWRSSVIQEVSGSTFETVTEQTFHPGGSYEAAIFVTLPHVTGMPPRRDQVSGVWRIRPLSPDRFVLTIEGPDGVTIDEKTMRIENDAAMRSIETGVTFSRIR